MSAMSLTLAEIAGKLPALTTRPNPVLGNESQPLMTPDGAPQTSFPKTSPLLTPQAYQTPTPSGAPT